MSMLNEKIGGVSKNIKYSSHCIVCEAKIF